MTAKLFLTSKEFQAQHPAMFKIKSASKYRNTKIERDGEKFDSGKEYARWCDLKLLVLAGKISALLRQPIYELQKEFKGSDGKHYRAINYRSDFQYCEGDQIILEEVKGFPTPEWKLKEKLFRYKYPEIELRIIK